MFVSTTPILCVCRICKKLVRSQLHDHVCGWVYCVFPPFVSWHGVRLIYICFSFTLELFKFCALAYFFIVCVLNYLFTYLDPFAMCLLPNWKETNARGHLPCGSFLFSFVHRVHRGPYPVVHIWTRQEWATPTSTEWLLQALLLCSHCLFLAFKRSAVGCRAGMTCCRAMHLNFFCKYSLEGVLWAIM